MLPTVDATFVISMIVFKLVWAWVVPCLFPGAVAEGAASSNLTWLASVTPFVLVAVLSCFHTSLGEAFKTRT
jgi:hypothetical protein